jgi:cytochrome c oxidase accessory protein FixG
MNTGEDEKGKRDESFRDSLATIDASGKRKWIFPKKPKGKFTKARGYVNIVLLAFLFGAPFVRIDGEPLLLFNLIERRFVIFGQVFWPQDFFIFVLVMITFVIFITLFTVVYGRLFCGWVCPQTIFMEGVFRKIEYWIDGDWKQQMKLKKQGWDREKITKRVAKHAIFFAISFIIANTFLAYIIGSEALIQIISEPPAQHLGGLASITVFSGVFFGVFAFFREQVCTTVCPYGRLQGVLLDRQSVVVAYDYERGEDRAKFRKNEDRSALGKGDCIDCGHCVHVCPTGIDIRNGTQLECVNCTACIDACDEMMVAVDLPTGLIRYASEEQIKTKEKFKLSTRARAYTVVLAILLGVVTTLLVTRSDLQVNVLRTPGVLFIKNDDGTISNLYNFKMINKSNRDMAISLVPRDAAVTVQIVGQQPFLEKQAVSEGAFFLIAPDGNFESGKAETKLDIYNSEGEMIETVKVRMAGPL